MYIRFLSSGLFVYIQFLSSGLFMYIQFLSSGLFMYIQFLSSGLFMYIQFLSSGLFVCIQFLSVVYCVNLFGIVYYVVGYFYNKGARSVVVMILDNSPCDRGLIPCEARKIYQLVIVRDYASPHLSTSGSMALLMYSYGSQII